MDTKLTLKLDKEIIALAKEYVKEQGISLKQFVEDYLRRPVKPKEYYIYEGLSPEVREIAMSFKEEGKISLTDYYDYKKSKADYLLKKYAN